MSKDSRSLVALLQHYLRPQGRWVMLLGFVLLITTAVQLINPQIIRRFVDLLGAAGKAADAIRLGSFYILLAFIQQASVSASVYLSERVGWGATNALREDLVSHCLKLDMGFHNSRTPGEMIERIDGDINALSNFFSQFTIQIFSNFLVLTGMLVMLFATDWRAGLTMTLVTLSAGSVIAKVGNLTTPLWEKERQASADLFGFLEERLNGTEDIRANGAGAYVLRRFYELSRILMRAGIKAVFMLNILFNSAFLMFAIAVAAGMAISAYLYLSGAISLGTAVMIVLLANMIENPLWRLINQIQDLQRASASVNRVGEFFALEAKLVESPPPTQKEITPGPFHVVFEQVGFAYTPSSPDVLHDLSFELGPGCVVGILGRTGSGKTTLARLMFRLYDVTEGVIRVNGRDLHSLSTGELRQNIGMVSQNIQLFHASLRDNLSFFDPVIPDERMVEIIEWLGLGDWFKQLPQGLETVLDSGGGGLSAGEAQLLAFARVFLKQPGLVILDEATARLDPATEALIERAVNRLTSQSTAMIIAHRLGTVDRATHIMVLEDGELIEFGEREKLARDPASRFSGYLRSGLAEVLS